MDPDNLLSSAKRSDDKMHNNNVNHIQANDTFQVGYYTHSHPSFQERQLFTNQLHHKEQSFYDHYIQPSDDDDEDDNELGQHPHEDEQEQQQEQEEEEQDYQNLENKSDQTITDCLPDNFFEQLKPQVRLFNHPNILAKEEENKKGVLSANGRSPSLKKRLEQKNDELLYSRAAKMQICQNLVQQQVDKEIKYMSNSKKMSQNSYRIVARKLEMDIQQKMNEIDPTTTKIITFSQLGRLLQLLNLFTAVKFDANSQIIIEEQSDPQKKLRFAQETMFHQQLWFFVVNYLNKNSVLGEIVFSTLRILMDPMQLTIKGTKDFLAQYMGRTLVYLEEDRKIAQEKTQGFQLWTLDEIIRTFRLLNEQKILREKSLNINTANVNNKKQPISKGLDKNIYTFKPNIDKNSQIIDEKHKKKFYNMNQNQIDKIDVSPIRNSLATQNNKSTQSTKKLINLLQSSQSTSQLLNPLNQQFNNNNGSNYAGNYNNNLQQSQNESNLLTNVTNDYRNTTLNTEFTNSSIEQPHQMNERFTIVKQKSLMSHYQHPSRSTLNQSNKTGHLSQYNSQGVNININGTGGELSSEDDGIQNQYFKMKRCETLRSFQIPEEDYYEDISHIPSNNYEKVIDRVDMMLQKKVQTQQKISNLKQQLIQKVINIKYKL